MEEKKCECGHKFTYDENEIDSWDRKEKKHIIIKKWQYYCPNCGKRIPKKGMECEILLLEDWDCD